MILRICPKALAGHYLRSEWKSGLRNRWPGFRVSYGQLVRGPPQLEARPETASMMI